MFVVFMAPDTTAAQGLVPVMCESPQTCGTCEFVELINNVIGFLLTFASIVATLLIVYGGFKLVTSGGNVSAKGEAKSIVTNVIIGYVLILTAFLIVNTVLGVLLPGDSRALGWQRIECLYPTQPVSQPYDEFDIAARNQQFDQDGFIGVTNTAPGSGSAVSCQVSQYGSCSLSAIQAAGFGSLAGDAALIVGAESGCNPSSESRTDTTTDGRTYSVGTWQINMAAHRAQCTLSTGESINIDCPSAFRPAATRNQYGVREQIVENEGVYRACVQALKDPRCNNEIAARIARRSGDMGDWACSARKCGVATSRNHLCPL